ncbi:MAG: o-succinylbenzoate synthase [Phormidium sp. GEM2.Bin31]|nr:MAG: o-succinylbenzoate synthase [Phormidium sp. GEM2.Bin31]
MYSLTLTPYDHPFRRPLTTHHGLWKHRQGMIIKLTDRQQRQGYGEIAPLPDFGSESLEAAQDFCQRFQGHLDDGDILSIPDDYPACQFALESAREALLRYPNPPLQPTFPHCQLLPTGEAALKLLQTTPKDHWGPSPCFKWKIAVAGMQQEQDWFQQLLQQLPPQSRLRLDANGGLSQEEAQAWLGACEGQPVEYLEQPRPPGKWQDLESLQHQGVVSIALDESVANLRDLETCLTRGWSGVIVIKAAIIGSPRRLRQLCQQFQPDVVFSSVFETSIGRQAALHLAAELQHQPRALGFGVTSVFRGEEPQSHRGHRGRREG